MEAFVGMTIPSCSLVGFTRRIHGKDRKADSEPVPLPGAPAQSHCSQGIESKFHKAKSFGGVRYGRVSCNTLNGQTEQTPHNVDTLQCVHYEVLSNATLSIASELRPDECQSQ